MGYQEKSPHIRLATPSPSPTSRPPETPATPPSATPGHGETSTCPLDKRSAISVPQTTPGQQTTADVTLNPSPPKGTYTVSATVEQVPG
jgi:hypothetical protein